MTDLSTVETELDDGVFSARLKDFLRGAISDLSNLDAPERFRGHEMDAWIRFFHRSINTSAVAARAGADTVKSYPVVAGIHSALGPCLVKFNHELLGSGRFIAFALNSGERRELSGDDMSGLRDLKVLFEVYRPGGGLTSAEIQQYLKSPVRALQKTRFALELMTMLIASSLFIINFNLLLYAVPAQNDGAVLKVVYLAAVLVIGTAGSLYLVNRLLVYTRSLTDERGEALRINLMWSARPAFWQEHGPAEVEGAATALVEAAKSRGEIVFLVLRSLVMLPAIVLMALRLPMALFAFVLVLSAFSAAVSVWLHITKLETGKTSARQNKDAFKQLVDMTGNVGRLKIFGETRQIYTRWRRKHLSRHQTAMATDDRLAPVEGWLETVAHTVTLVGIFAITIMISRLDPTITQFTIADAFIILHLSVATHQIMPSVSEVFKKHFETRFYAKSAKALTEEIAAVNAPAKALVTTAQVSVTCTDLVLPHGCRFLSGDALTTRFEGPAVVQIAGESGAGKSTFLRCLVGLEKPEYGTLSVMGCDPVLMSPDERRRVFGYVGQSVDFISGTLRDNLKLLADGQAPDRVLWDTLERVRLSNQVSKLPLGLDTPITDTRRSFSTGEKQRIILAQTLLKSSQILVLDEALSGLPEKEEIAIFKNMSGLFTQLYFVSHREHLKGVATHSIQLAGDQLA